MMIASAPAAAIRLAACRYCSSLVWPAVRIFTVSGRLVASRMALTIFCRFCGLSSKAEPEPLLRILGLGQPQFKSIKSGLKLLQILTALAKVLGLLPDN